MKRLSNTLANLCVAVAALCLLLPAAAHGQSFVFAIPGGQYLVGTPVSGGVEVSSWATVPATGNLVIPRSVQVGITFYPIVSIGSFAATTISSVSLPNTVTNISNRAFKNCTNLAAIDLGDSVEVLGTEAFYHCTALDSLLLPPALRSIGRQAFEGCTALHGVIAIPPAVVTLPNGAFKECRSLQGVVLSGSVTKVGQECFASCDSLASVQLSAGVDTLDAGAFAFCRNLSVIALPPTLCAIGYGAFEGCHSLVSVSIPDSVGQIGDYAFRQCSSLSSVAVGASVRSIGQYAFQLCASLDTIDLLPLAPPVLGMQAFASTPEAKVFRVPCGLGTAYGSAWGSGYHISERVPELSILLQPDNPERGTATTDGGVRCDSSVVVLALPNSGYRFEAWSNGSNANPDTLHLVGDTMLTAFFVPEEFRVTLTSNRDEWGTVSGAGIYPFGSQAILVATPAQGCLFEKWSDGDADNPRTVVVESDTAFKALFRPTDGIQPTPIGRVKVYATDGGIAVEGATGNRATVADAHGAVVCDLLLTGQKTVLHVPAQGLYLVRIGSSPPRKIIVLP